MSDYLDPNNEELLKDFFMEAELQVETFEQNILALENEPLNKEAVDEIFRAAQTLKGAAGTVQMDELSHFTHLCEDTLDEIRSGKVEVTAEVVDIILEAIDIIKAMLEARADGNVYQEDISEVSGKLENFIGGNEAAPNKPADKNKTETAYVETGPSEYDILEMNEKCGENERIAVVHIVFNEDNPMNTVGGVQVYAALKKSGTVISSTPDFDELYKDVFHPEADFYIATELNPEDIEKTIQIPDVILSSRIKLLEEEDVENLQDDRAPAEAAYTKGPETPAGSPVVESQPGDKSEQRDDSKPPEQKARRSQKSSGSILRVDSRRIDNLLNLVSETVITKASFNQISSSF
ncbi:MAG TPA: hypothetical protein DCO79_14000 [Spirochaeta sp.]|nr:hypothetical protein [Spirochaeta sp.]